MIALGLAWAAAGALALFVGWRVVVHQRAKPLSIRERYRLWRVERRLWRAVSAAAKRRPALEPHDDRTFLRAQKPAPRGKR